MRSGTCTGRIRRPRQATGGSSTNGTSTECARCLPRAAPRSAVSGIGPPGTSRRPCSRRPSRTNRSCRRRSSVRSFPLWRCPALTRQSRSSTSATNRWPCTPSRTARSPDAASPRRPHRVPSPPECRSRTYGYPNCRSVASARAAPAATTGATRWPLQPSEGSAQRPARLSRANRVNPFDRHGDGALPGDVQRCSRRHPRTGIPG